MNARQQKSPAAPASEAGAATPFFARFLENQGGGGGPAAQAMTLKYPSDRDEIDWNLSPEAATNNAGPSRMTLKYPSDRDEIDNYSS